MDARTLAAEACREVQETGGEFEKLPEAYSRAADLAARAASGDATWKEFALRVSASRSSFAKVQSGAESDADFTAFQADYSTLNQDCAALGHPIADD